MSRRTPFLDIVKHPTPFFVVRQILCGAGRVGIGVDSRTNGFQLAQRSDFFETEVGLETTLKRPIINTRDERTRQPTSIVGCTSSSATPTTFDVANLLKLGTTSLVLGMIEDGWLQRDLTLQQPVATLQRIPHDPTLRARVTLASGQGRPAWTCWRCIATKPRRGWTPPWRRARPRHRRGHAHWWGTTLDRPRRDPMEARGEVDWVAARPPGGLSDRDALGWGDPRLKAVDIQWSDVRAERGLAHRFGRHRSDDPPRRRGGSGRTMTRAPGDTRAWFWGHCERPRRGGRCFLGLGDRRGRGPTAAAADPDSRSRSRGTRDQVGDSVESARRSVGLLTRLSAPA